MGVARFVHNLLWNASCASPPHRQQLVDPWVDRTLEAASIDMSFATPLIVTQVYNLGNFQWVLLLLLPQLVNTSALSLPPYVTCHTLWAQTRRIWLPWI